MGDRPLVKHDVHIDLPGEPVHVTSDTETTILLRKHRDVVFDIKLQAGATYTVTTTNPDKPNGRFYDPKRKLNTNKTTFKDGEQCHLWLGRTFEGSLILKERDKEIGRYPVRKIDCTRGCTGDPKDKPAPLLIVMHGDQQLARDLQVLQNSALGAGMPSTSVTAAFDRAKRGGGLQDSPFSDRPQPAAAMLTNIPNRASMHNGAQEVQQMAHLFEVKPSRGIDAPDDILQFFARGDEKYKIDPNKDICRNWIIGQMAGIGGYFRDALSGDEAWLRQFWRRTFYLVRSEGKFVMMFATGPEDWRVVGVLLTGYRKVVSSKSQIVSIAGGAGDLSGTARAAWGTAKESVFHGAGVALAISMGIDAMVWFDAYRKGDKDLLDLFVMLGIDLAKAGIVAGATSIIVSGLITAWAAIFTTAAVTMLAVAIGTVIVTIAVAYAVDIVFDKFGVAEKAKSLIIEVGNVLEKGMPKDYGEMYTNYQWAVVP